MKSNHQLMYLKMTTMTMMMRLIKFHRRCWMPTCLLLSERIRLKLLLRLLIRAATHFLKRMTGIRCFGQLVTAMKKLLDCSSRETRVIHISKTMMLKEATQMKKKLIHLGNLKTPRRLVSIPPCTGPATKAT